MVTVVLWVAILIRKHGLLACILENFLNMAPYGHSFWRMTEYTLTVLVRFLPEFSWRANKSDLSDFMRPQTRVRIFIRGLRRSVAESVPRNLPPFGRCPLRNVLAHHWPTYPRWCLTQQHQKNLVNYEAIIRNLYVAGKILPDDPRYDDIFVVELNHDSPFYMINQVPALTINNRYLFLISVADVINQVEDKSREFFRFLLATERLALQGFPPEAARDFPSEQLIIKATGNAYPPPLIMAAAAPLIQAMGADRPAGDNFNFATWPASFQSDVSNSKLYERRWFRNMFLSLTHEKLVSPPPLTKKGTLGLATCFTLQSWAKTCSMNRTAQTKTNTHDP